MTRKAGSSRWRECAGCGRERRLAAGGLVMCRHNRWDAVARAMVPCEGSGRDPAPEAGQEQAGTRGSGTAVLVRGAG